MQEYIPGHTQFSYILFPRANKVSKPDEELIFVWFEFEILWQNRMEENCESVMCSDVPVASGPKSQKNTDTAKKKMN